MSLDREICLCFHVTLRKVIQYVRHENPVVPSQISQCMGAGTGCGWCRPYLKKIFEQMKQEASSPGIPNAEIEAVARYEKEMGTRIGIAFDDLTPSDYAQKRTEHIRQGKGTPPKSTHD